MLCVFESRVLKFKGIIRMLDNNKFYKLKIEIENGPIRYVIKSILPGLLGVLIGKIIGAYLLGNDLSFAYLQDELSLTIIIFIIFGFVFGVISWRFKMSKYQKESKRRENT